MFGFINELDEEFSFTVKPKTAAGVPIDNSLLLEIEVPFLKNGDGYYIEQQALNGIEKWADNFDRLTVCAYAVTREQADETMVWASPASLLKQRNIKLVELPIGFHPKDFLLHRQSVKTTFEQLIPKHQYLCFSSFGGFGKWGNVAVDVAMTFSRAYSVWFDNVVEEMPQSDSASFTRQIKRLLEKGYEKQRVIKAIKQAEVGLFHGKTVFNGYKDISPNPQVVHDIHISANDVISDDDLTEKLARIPYKATLNIGYVGRVDAIKGPKDWLNIVEKLANKVGRDKVNATWVGNGSMLAEMKALVAEKQLDDVIRFKGILTDRNEVLQFLREQDIFVFCHLTPESPRNLIESIISATPIVGYESAYAQDLVGEHGGAMLTPVSDIDAVVDNLSFLIDNPLSLQALTEQVAQSRGLYNSEAVFKHRSDLIKSYVKPKTALATA